MGDEPEFALTGGPLEVLFERAGLPGFPLPASLARFYGGAFGIGRPRLFANFVSSLDGVVAFDGSGESGHVISGNSDADRFVMGLLRACAGAIVVGAGTLRASPKHLWTAEKIFPPAARLFAELRKTLGLSEEPTFVVVTASGDVEPSSPALREALVVTTPRGEARLRGTLPARARVATFDSDASGALRLAPILERLRADGHERVLTEGGPSLVGRLLAEDLVDELFLTVSPRLFGHAPGDAQKRLVGGVDLGGKPLELLSARRQGSHLFLRYALARAPR